MGDKKLTAVVIGEMPGLQSVSGGVPARDAQKLTTHTHTHTHTYSHREKDPQHILYDIFLSLLPWKLSGLPLKNPHMQLGVRACLCVYIAARKYFCGGVDMCICISQIAVCGDD